MWIDKRHHWHVLYEGGCSCDVGHAWSRDGLTWSNITGAANTTRPVLNLNGTVTNVSYYIGRDRAAAFKLLPQPTTHAPSPCDNESTTDDPSPSDVEARADAFACAGPKFMLGVDGFTPTHLYGGAGSPEPVKPPTSVTIVSPLAGGI
eukprot:5567034-Prymnesium_polylepis.1